MEALDELARVAETSRADAAHTSANNTALVIGEYDPLVFSDPKENEISLETENFNVVVSNPQERVHPKPEKPDSSFSSIAQIGKEAGDE